MVMAATLLEELVLYVRPRHDIEIRLTERPDETGTSNWMATTLATDRETGGRLSRKIAALRKDFPKVDWEGVTDRLGDYRTIARSVSKLKAR